MSALIDGQQDAVERNEGVRRTAGENARDEGTGLSELQLRADWVICGAGTAKAEVPWWSADPHDRADQQTAGNPRCCE